MDFHRPTTVASNGAGISLQDLVRGERARALKVQLANWHPECPPEEIEDAIQTACKRFLERAEGITEAGQVYTWIRTTAHRELNREAAQHAHELVADYVVEEELETLEAGGLDPAAEAISGEDDADLAKLVDEVYASLPDQKRDILALYVAGHKRPEIADRLGLTQRKVKRELLEIMDEARAVLAGLVGGGCQHGEPLMVRFVCGLSTSAEEVYAREHLARCGRCEIFCERLLAWRDKAGVMLPVPATEGATPGLIERALHKSAEGLSSLKQHIVDGGAQAKQQVAASSYRAVDPTPLAVARPGTVATAVATCILAIGGGATYCVERGVNPLGAARGLIASASEGEPEPAAPAPEPESTGPTYTPVEPSPESEEAPVSESAPPPAEEKPEPEPESPPSEDSFEPVSPAYASSEGEAEATETYEASEPAPVESTGRPAPVAASAPPEFGGP
jgi:RNA polymerase sigma factor (sigma-70 family)